MQWSHNIQSQSNDIFLPISSQNYFWMSSPHWLLFFIPTFPNSVFLSSFFLFCNSHQKMIIASSDYSILFHVFLSNINNFQLDLFDPEMGPTFSVGRNGNSVVILHSLVLPKWSLTIPIINTSGVIWYLYTFPIY